MRRRIEPVLWNRLSYTQYCVTKWMSVGGFKLTVNPETSYLFFVVVVGLPPEAESTGDDTVVGWLNPFLS